MVKTARGRLHKTTYRREDDALAPEKEPEDADVFMPDEEALP